MHPDALLFHGSGEKQLITSQALTGQDVIRTQTQAQLNYRGSYHISVGRRDGANAAKKQIHFFLYVERVELSFNCLTNGENLKSCRPFLLYMMFMSTFDKKNMKLMSLGRQT
jgi:hypothetical protein